MPGDGHGDRHDSATKTYHHFRYFPDIVNGFFGLERNEKPYLADVS
jgi:hypothetical protein